MNPSIPKNLVLSAVAAAFCGALPATAAVPPESPYATPQPPFYGQVRTRLEYDQKALTDTATKQGVTLGLLRSRLGFVAVPSPNVEIKLELQDSRAWGGETPVVGANPATATVAPFKSADANQGFDLTQGYVAVEEGPFKTALGRQKLTLGSGRFLSTLEWNNHARAFDGWSFNLNLDPGDLTGLAYVVRDTNTAWSKDMTTLAGLYYSHQITSDVVAEAYSFYDRSRLPAVFSGDTTANYDLVYLGERTAGRLGMLAWEEEFIWQTGEYNMKGANKSSAAFQLGTRLGVVFGGDKLNAGLDMMSGDDKPADNDLHTYRANYYFAHALYGWMDYFVNNPRYGVVDYRLDAELPFWNNPAGNPRVTLKPQYHFFTPQNAATAAPATDKPYGQEFDFEAHLGLYPKSDIVLGAGLFLPGDGAYQIGAPATQAGRTALKGRTVSAAGVVNPASNTEPGLYLYFMPTFNF